MNDKTNTDFTNILDEDDMEDLRVTLTLEDDTEVECQILTIFELEEQNYIVLTPEEEDEDSDEQEVYIYRYFEDDDGNPSLENIEDEEEYEAVTDCLEEILDEAEWDSLLDE